MRCSRVILWACAAAGMMLASCESARTRRVLDDVASFIEARPDSALAVLESVKPAEFGAADPSDSALVLRTRSGRARFSMLYSMALDKNYIDLTSDSIVAPAIAYYSRHGRPDDRLKAHYYRARIAENAGDLETALEWLVKGELFFPKCRDYSAVGRLYASKATQYYNTYHYHETLDKERFALDFYHRANDTLRVTVSRLNIVTALICLDSMQVARDSMDSIRKEFVKLNSLQKKRFCEYNLKLSIWNMADMQESLALVYDNFHDPDDYPLLEMARAYIVLECPDSSMMYLRKIQERDPKSTTRPAYFTALSKMYVLLGDYYSAYDNEHNYINYELNDLYRRMQSEINYVEEKTKTSYENKLAKSRLFGWILLLSLLVLASGVVVYLVYKRLSENRRETERLNGLYESLLKEKEGLEKLVSDSGAIDVQTRGLLADRLGKVENVLLNWKKGGIGRREQVRAQLDELVENQRYFLTTLSLLYSVGHPDFAGRLNGYSLTDTEIGYCCLYAMGLDAWEVASLLNTKNAYNTNASIRKKLGLQDCLTPLPEYLRNLPL